MRLVQSDCFINYRSLQSRENQNFTKNKWTSGGENVFLQILVAAVMKQRSSRLEHLKWNSCYSVIWCVVLMPNLMLRKKRGKMMKDENSCLQFICIILIIISSFKSAERQSEAAEGFSSLRLLNDIMISPFHLHQHDTKCSRFCRTRVVWLQPRLSSSLRCRFCSNGTSVWIPQRSQAPSAAY